jgi:hypothetical protein
MRVLVVPSQHSILASLLCLLALATSGCAGAAAARDLSTGGAKLTDGYKTDMQNFFQAQDQMVQGTADSIATRKRLAADLNNLTRVQRASWQAANNAAAIRMYDALSAQSDATILTSNIDLQSLHPIATTATTTIDPQQFDSVTKTLNEMAQPPSLKDQITFLVQEGQDVANQYQKSLKDGAKCANTANAAGKDRPPDQQLKPKAPAAPPSCASQ